MTTMSLVLCPVMRHRALFHLLSGLRLGGR